MEWPKLKLECHGGPWCAPRRPSTNDITLGVPFNVVAIASVEICVWDYADVNLLIGEYVLR